MLYHCPSNMKDGRNELVERITSRYQQLCTTIETAVKGIYQEFIGWVESVIAGNLNKNNKNKKTTEESLNASNSDGTSNEASNEASSDIVVAWLYLTS